MDHARTVGQQLASAEGQPYTLGVITDWMRPRLGERPALMAGVVTQGRSVGPTETFWPREAIRG